MSTATTKSREETQKNTSRHEFTGKMPSCKCGHEWIVYAEKNVKHRIKWVTSSFSPTGNFYFDQSQLN